MTEVPQAHEQPRVGRPPIPEHEKRRHEAKTLLTYKEWKMLDDFTNDHGLTKQAAIRLLVLQGLKGSLPSSVISRNASSQFYRAS